MSATIDYKVKTFVNVEAESIMVELTRNQVTVSKWIMDTREALIREALIKLGWTPPIKSPASVSSSAIDQPPASPRLSDPSESCLRSEPSGRSVEPPPMQAAPDCLTEAPQAQKPS